jgi:hypothetical protein
MTAEGISVKVADETVVVDVTMTMLLPIEEMANSLVHASVFHHTRRTTSPPPANDDDIIFLRHTAEANQSLPMLLSPSSTSVPSVSSSSTTIPLLSQPEPTLIKAMCLSLLGLKESSPTKRVQLAQRALELHPHCVDAFYLLIHNHSSSTADALDTARRGWDVAMKLVGGWEGIRAFSLHHKQIHEKMVKEREGEEDQQSGKSNRSKRKKEKNSPSSTQTSSFVDPVDNAWNDFTSVSAAIIRSVFRLCDTFIHLLIRLENLDEAAALAEAMLKHNPSDHLAVRFVTSELLCRLQRFDDVLRLLTLTYPNEVNNERLFTHALAVFATTPTAAHPILVHALHHNRHVAPLLLSTRCFLTTQQLHAEVPPEQIDDVVEAMRYADQFGAVWATTPGALSFLRHVAAPFVTSW